MGLRILCDDQYETSLATPRSRRSFNKFRPPRSPPQPYNVKPRLNKVKTQLVELKPQLIEVEFEPFELKPQLIELESPPREQLEPQPEDPDPHSVELNLQPVEREAPLAEFKAQPIALPSQPVESKPQPVGLQSLPNELMLEIFRWVGTSESHACRSYPSQDDGKVGGDHCEKTDLSVLGSSQSQGCRHCNCDPLARVSVCMWRVLPHNLLAVNRQLRWLAHDYIHRNEFEVGPFLYEDCTVVRKAIEMGDPACHERVRRLNLHVLVTDLFLSNAMGTNTIWRLLFDEMRKRFTQHNAIIKVVMWFCGRMWKNEFDWIVLMIKDIAAYIYWPNLCIESRDLPSEDEVGIERLLKANFGSPDHFYEDSEHLQPYCQISF